MVNSVYNYLPKSIFSKTTSNYKSSNKNDLKKIYSAIVNLNRKSPSYLIKSAPDREHYTLGVKESAISLHSSLSSFLETSELLASNKKVVSSQPEAAEIFISTDDFSSLPEPFTLQINQLAAGQVNTGRDTYDLSNSLIPGNYSFIIGTDGNQYEFQFNIKENSSNLTIQTTLADFINHSNINLEAKVLPSSNSNHSQMQIKSLDTESSCEPTFYLNDETWPKHSQGLIDYFELNNITSAPTNAKFLINNEPKETQTNSFTLGACLSVHLNRETNQPISIGFNADYDSVLNSLKQVTGQYNNCIDFVNQYSSTQKGATKLINSLKQITSSYNYELESYGISFDEQNKLQIDESLFLQSPSDNEENQMFQPATRYLQALLDKTSEIILNPMEYVDKTMVTYPNSLNPAFPNPYMTSMYSGMMFNYYC